MHISHPNYRVGSLVRVLRAARRGPWRIVGQLKHLNPLHGYCVVRATGEGLRGRVQRQYIRHECTTFPICCIHPYHSIGNSHGAKLGSGEP